MVALHARGAWIAAEPRRDQRGGRAPDARALPRRAAADRRRGRRRPRSRPLVRPRGRLVLEPAAHRRRAGGRRDLGLLRRHGVVGGGAARQAEPRRLPRGRSTARRPRRGLRGRGGLGERDPRRELGGDVGGRRSQPALPAGGGGARRSRTPLWPLLRRSRLSSAAQPRRPAEAGHRLRATRRLGPAARSRCGRRGPSRSRAPPPAPPRAPRSGRSRDRARDPGSGS